MPLLGLRDLVSPHYCPECKSLQTERIGRASDDTRIIKCHSCGYAGPVTGSVLSLAKSTLSRAKSNLSPGTFTPPGDMYGHNEPDK